jgi:hypothetical protein
MKELNILQMEEIQAGITIGQGCAIWGLTNLVTGGAASANPVGAVISGGCVVWGLGAAFGLW